MPLQKLPVTGLDDINHRRRARETINQVLDHSFDDSKVQTPAEIAAGVTPINKAYPPGYVDRYGTNTVPGTTSMRAAWQAAIDVARAGGIDVRYGATWPYLIDGPLDLTTPVGATRFGFSIVNEGHQSAVTENAPYYPSIIVDHDGVVFDCTGNLGINWIDLTITTKATPTTDNPTICFLLARNTDGGSSFHKFERVRVLGNFRTAILYNYGAEDDQYDNCQFFNYLNDTATKCMYFTANNVLGVTSDFTTIATGAQSTIDHKFMGGVYYLKSNDAASDLVYLEGVADSFKMIACWVGVFDVSGHARSLFYFDGQNSATNFFQLANVTGEQGSGVEPEYGMLLSDHARTHIGWGIRDSLLPCHTNVLSAPASQTFDNLHISNLQELSNHGIDVAGVIQNSCLDTNALPLNIGTSRRNRLSGQCDGWTVTTRDNDVWEDRSISRSFTPDTSPITFSGASTISASAEFSNGRVIVQIELSAATSITAAAGNVIGDLPRNPLLISADVKFINTSTGVEVSGGFVSGSGIVCPAFSTGAGEIMLIHAGYFVV